MSTEPAKFTPFNPGWITAVYAVVGGVVAGVVSTAVTLAVTSRDVSDLRTRQDADDAWRAGIERRISDDKLTSSNALVALQKDMERANKTLDSLDQALRVAGFQNLKTSANSTP